MSLPVITSGCHLREDEFLITWEHMEFVGDAVNGPLELCSQLFSNQTPLISGTYW
jgi:hypothetical protein